MLTAAATHDKLKEMQKSWLIHNEREMMLLGRYWGQRAQRGDLFFLFGDLGSGKTVFAKGVAAGLGIDAVVDSPTFQILKSYQGRLPLFHLDLYRLNKAAELEILEPELLGEQGVTVVEWGELWIKALQPENYLEIRIAREADWSQRQVLAVLHGTGNQHWVEDLAHVHLGD